MAALIAVVEARLKATQLQLAQVKAQIQESNQAIQQIQNNQARLVQSSIELNAVVRELQALLAPEPEPDDAGTLDSPLPTPPIDGPVVMNCAAENQENSNDNQS